MAVKYQAGRSIDISGTGTTRNNIARRNASEDTAAIAAVNAIDQAEAAMKNLITVNRRGEGGVRADRYDQILSSLQRLRADLSKARRLEDQGGRGRM